MISRAQGSYEIGGKICQVDFNIEGNSTVVSFNEYLDAETENQRWRTIQGTKVNGCIGLNISESNTVGKQVMNDIEKWLITQEPIIINNLKSI